MTRSCCSWASSARAPIAYGVSKAGLNALADIFRDELAGNAGIRIEYCDPGPMRTPMRRKAFPGALPEEMPAAESTVPAILARLVGG